MIVHRGDRFQAGRGIGSLFGGLIRGLKPLVSMGLSTGKKILGSKLVKDIGSTALQMGKDTLKNVAADLIEGKDVNETLNKELDNAKHQIASTIRGSGKRKRKRQCKTLTVSKRKFNLLLD